MSVMRSSLQVLTVVSNDDVALSYRLTWIIRTLTIGPNVFIMHIHYIIKGMIHSPSLMPDCSSVSKVYSYTCNEDVLVLVYAYSPHKDQMWPL